MQENLKNLYENRYLHLISLIIIFTIVFIESRLMLSLLGTQLGTGEYALNIAEFGTVTQITMGIPALLANLIGLPQFASLPLFLIIFRLCAAISMYYLVYYLLTNIRSAEKRQLRIMFAVIGALVYIHYPYNIIGDNFTALVIVRAIAPLFLLALLGVYSSRKILSFMGCIPLFALMMFLDPRSIFFAGVPALFIIVIPKMLSSSIGRGTITLCLFLIILSGGFLLSSFSIFPRFNTEESVPTSVHVPLVKDAFRYQYASLDNVVRGLSFESTKVQYAGLIEPQYSVISDLGLALLLILSVFLIPLSSSAKDLKFTLPPLILVFMMILLFTSFGDEPLIIKIIFSDLLETTRESNSFADALTIFRTPRVMDMILGMVYAILVPFSLLNIIQRFNDMRRSQKFKTISNWDHHCRSRVINIAVGILSIYLIFSVSWIFLVNGDLYMNNISRANDYDRIRSEFKDDVMNARVISVPFSEGIWNFPQKPVGLGNSVLRYFYAYSISPEIQTSLLKKGNLDDLAESLRWMGIKYLVVDENQMLGKGIREKLDGNANFSMDYHTGNLYVYLIKEYKPVILPESAVFVLGGYETFRDISWQLDWNDNTVAPIFLDNPLNQMAYSAPFPIAISQEKSILDLTLSLLANDNRAILIQPSKFTTQYSPSRYWSPGDVTDSHHSVWTWNIAQSLAYQWEYSGRADYRYVFTSAKDILTTSFTVSKEEDYDIFARVLMNNQNVASLSFSIDDSNETLINTSWDDNKSEFKWLKLGNFHLIPGKHKIDIQNEKGTNALNIIVATPAGLTQEFQERADTMIQNNGYLVKADIVNNPTTSDVEIKSLVDSKFTVILKVDDTQEYESFNLDINDLTYTATIMDKNTVRFDSVSLNEGAQYGTLYATYGKSDEIDTMGMESLTYTPTDYQAWSTELPRYFAGEIESTAKDTSYKVSSNSTDPNSWSWIQSPNIPIKPNDVYKIQTKMKWENIRQSHIAIDYLTNSSEIPRRLDGVPYGLDGNSDWQTFEKFVIIPPDAVSLKISLNAGWTADTSVGNGITWFGETNITRVNMLSPESIVIFGPVGSFADKLAETPQFKINQKQVSIESPYPGYREYNIAASIGNDAVFVIPETYSATYKLSSNETDHQVVSFPVFDVFTGFYIKAEDDNLHDINIRIYDDTKRTSAENSSSLILLLGILPVIGFVLDEINKKYKFICFIRVKMEAFVSVRR